MFDEVHITHKNNGVGFGLCSWQGHQAAQNDAVYSTMYNLINATHPDRIVEIGTAAGGLTMFVDWCVTDLKLNTHVITFDKEDTWNRQTLLDAGIDFRVRSWCDMEPPHSPTQSVFAVQLPSQSKFSSA